MEDFLQLDINIEQNLALGNYFAIYLKDSIGANYNIIAEITEQRTGKYQVELGNSIEGTLLNLANSFKLDYGNEFNISKNISGLTLNSKTPGWQFLNGLKQPNDLQISFNPNIIPILNFNISSINFTQAIVDKCSKVKVIVTTSHAMTSYCVNQLCNTINTNVLEFEYFRGASVLLNLKGPNGESIDKIIEMPPLIESVNDKIKVVVTNGINGATANVIYPYTDLLIYEFSLDNINWQQSTTFADLLEGNFNLYVRDNLGCSKVIPFSILSENFTTPVVEVSKENSIRFISPKIDFETDENRGFCESDSKLNYGFIQEFLDSDIITTQFRSNYNSISVKVFDFTEDIESIIPINKITHNIGLKAKYNQVLKYPISSTQFGIYFEQGQILDYDTGQLLDTYSLNGALPIWASLGNILKIDGIDYKVDTIGFDENVNAEVLIFNGAMALTPTFSTVSTVYNLQEYEVYEFVLDMSLYANKEIKIKIENSDPNFGECTFLSERLSINQTLNNYLEIRYSNSTNTNIIYSSGISHLLRLPFNQIKAVDSDSNESYKTDTNAHLLNADVYEITEFEFIPLPLELFRKLKIALSMDKVFINGTGYIKNAEFQKENLGVTNLYKLSAQMIKNGYTFNTNKNTAELIVDGTINLPGLIETNSNGYIQL